MYCMKPIYLPKHIKKEHYEEISTQKNKPKLNREIILLQIVSSINIFIVSFIFHKMLLNKQNKNVAHITMMRQQHNILLRRISVFHIIFIGNPASFSLTSSTLSPDISGLETGVYVDG